MVYVRLLVAFVAARLAFLLSGLLAALDGLDAQVQHAAYRAHAERADRLERSDPTAAAVEHDRAARRVARLADLTEGPTWHLCLLAEGHRQSARRLRELHLPPTSMMLPAAAGNAKGW